MVRWGPAVLDSNLVGLAGCQQPLYAVFAQTAAPRRAPISINGRDRLDPTGGTGNYGASSASWIVAFSDIFSQCLAQRITAHYTIHAVPVRGCLAPPLYLPGFSPPQRRDRRCVGVCIWM